jgi:hypothetical protein
MSEPAAGQGAAGSLTPLAQTTETKEGLDACHTWFQMVDVPIRQGDAARAIGDGVHPMLEWDWQRSRPPQAG